MLENLLNRIICGDCLEVMKDIPDKSIDLVLTDPPYGMNYQSARRTDKTQWKPKIANDKQPYIWFLKEVSQKLKNGGCLISFCRFDSWFAFAFGCELAGLEVKAEIVWDKMNHGTGDLKGCPVFRHEIAIFATKGRFIFHDKRPQSLFATPRINPIDLKHPNEKPVKLMEWLIEHYCPENGLVLDPFTGASPVGLASKKLNRNFIGIELSPEYCKIAEERLKAVQNKI